MKRAAFLLLCSTIMFAQTPRKCDPGYTLQANGRCIGEFPAGDGCNTITADQDGGPISETTVACLPYNGILGGEVSPGPVKLRDIKPEDIPNENNPPKEAKITDGETPEYKTVPVTQKIPTCKPGFELKHFVQGNAGDLGGMFINPESFYSTSHWEDAPAPNADFEWHDYRCFPAKQSGNYHLNDMLPKIRGLATHGEEDDWGPGVDLRDLESNMHGDYYIVYNVGGKLSGTSDDPVVQDVPIADTPAYDTGGIAVQIDNNTRIPDGIICEKGTHYVLIKLVLRGIIARAEGPTGIDGCYKDGATVTITLPK